MEKLKKEYVEKFIVNIPKSYGDKIGRIDCIIQPKLLWNWIENNFISKVSSQLEPLVIPKIAEESTHKTKYEVDIYTNIKWLTAWTGDLDGAKSFINDIKPTNIYRLVKRTYTETKETIESNFSE